MFLPQLVPFHHWVVVELHPQILEPLTDKHCKPKLSEHSASLLHDTP